MQAGEQTGSAQGRSDEGSTREIKSKLDDVWIDIDSRFRRTMDKAERAYRTNYWINLIIVATGMVFVGSSLYFSYSRGIDASTLTYAGLGIADFVALFLVNPQNRIQQLIADLNQIMMIYRTWLAEVWLIEGYPWEWSDKDFTWRQKRLTFEELKSVNLELSRIAQEALGALETYVGAERK